MIYDAIDVAGFVVDTVHSHGKNVTNLHLQKILYYLELDKLKKEERPLFRDAIEAWKLGPVYPNVYHEYKVFGSDNINYIPSIFKFDKNPDNKFVLKKYEYSTDLIEESDSIYYRDSVLKLSSIDPFDLVKKTHSHTPWIEMKPQIFENQKGLTYDKEKLAAYIRQHPNKLDEVYGG